MLEDSEQWNRAFKLKPLFWRFEHRYDCIPVEYRKHDDLVCGLMAFGIWLIFINNFFEESISPEFSGFFAVGTIYCFVVVMLLRKRIKAGVSFVKSFIFERRERNERSEWSDRSEFLKKIDCLPAKMLKWIMRNIS